MITILKLNSTKINLKFHIRKSVFFGLIYLKFTNIKQNIAVFFDYIIQILLKITADIHHTSEPPSDEPRTY